MTTTKPLGNRIVAEVIDTVRDSLIELPPTVVHLDKISRAKVLSKGSKVGNKLQVGDIVIFDSKFGQRLKDFDNRRILDVGCLLAVEEKMAS